MEQSPYAEKLETLKSYNNFQLRYKNEDLKMGLIVTDKYLALSLYKRSDIEYDVATQVCLALIKRLLSGERGFLGIIRSTQKRNYMIIMLCDDIPYEEFFKSNILEQVIPLHFVQSVPKQTF